MAENNLREAGQQLFLNKLAGTGAYLVSFGYTIASVCGGLAAHPKEAVGYGFCAVVAWAATGLIGNRIDEANSAIEDLKKGGLEKKL